MGVSRKMFENTKGKKSRRLKLKDRQYIDQIKEDKKTNNNPQNSTQKTKD